MPFDAAGFGDTDQPPTPQRRRSASPAILRLIVPAAADGRSVLGCMGLVAGGHSDAIGLFGAGLALAYIALALAAAVLCWPSNRR